ncbi:MAG TPA: hypothetical protein VER37_08290, partial [Thermomicrobiales bacterium]|nr:hypothetical protein [Thermomicrobiales bacterium]
MALQATVVSDVSSPRPLVSSTIPPIETGRVLDEIGDDIERGTDEQIRAFAAATRDAQGAADPAAAIGARSGCGGSPRADRSSGR